MIIFLSASKRGQFKGSLPFRDLEKHSHAGGLQHALSLRKARRTQKIGIVAPMEAHTHGIDQPSTETI